MLPAFACLDDNDTCFLHPLKACMSDAWVHTNIFVFMRINT